MPKHKDFGFQRRPRPEQSDHGAPEQSAEIAHHQQASADSLTLTSRFGFAVGTAGAMQRAGLDYFLSELNERNPNDPRRNGSAGDALLAARYTGVTGLPLTPDDSDVQITVDAAGYGVF